MLSGSSEVPNAPRKQPKLTWHATWHHGGKYWQKNLYSLIFSDLLLLSLSLLPSPISHTLPLLSLSPLSFHHGRLHRHCLLLPIVLLATTASYGEEGTVDTDHEPPRPWRPLARARTGSSAVELARMGSRVADLPPLRPSDPLTPWRACHGATLL